MKVRAVHRNARMAPRKIRPLASLVRGMSAVDADAQLTFVPGKAAQIVRGVLASAVANAKENHGANREQLKVSDIRVDEGLKMRRFKPVSKGMAHPYVKAMAHVTVVVESTEKLKDVKKKAAIETIDATSYVELGGHEEAPEAEKVTEDGKAGVAETEARSVETTTDKTTGEAFQKSKMMQQGGNKKKTHRRKAV